MLSKRASWALYLSMLGIISAGFLYLTTDLAHAQPIREQLGFLGQNQLSILNADNYAQRVLFYIDKAASSSSWQAIDDLAEGGGFAAPPSCGEYLGYAQWQNIVQELHTDDHGNSVSRPVLKRCVSERMDDAFALAFNQHMRSRLAETPSMPQSMYDITLVTEEGKTRIIGNAQQPIDITIMKDFSAAALRPAVMPRTVMPGTNRITCTNTVDEIITDVNYLDGLKIWVPAQATCGGVFPVLAVLHGNNPNHNTEFTIGTGFNADGSRGRGLEQAIKQHIANGGYPIILVEPVHFKSGCGDGLWGDDFDINALMDSVRTRLQQANIQIASMSVAGHSGANCCPNTGMNKIANAVQSGLDLKLYGVIDGACSVTAYPENAMNAFQNKETVIFHMTNGLRGGDQDYHEKLIAGGATAEDCDASKFTACKKTAGKDWYSFISAGTTHWTIIERAMQEMTRRFFMEPPAGVQLVADWSEETGTEETGLTTWTTGSCAGFVIGSVPYQEDEKIECGDPICCMQPETRAQVERTKEFLQSGQSLVITDAARKTMDQRNAFLGYLAGGAAACGPRGLPITKQALAEIVPDGSTDEARLPAALQWLNSPSGLPYKDIIMDESRYSGCRHVQGRAVDIQIKENPRSAESIQTLRDIMCGAGWANFGGEWWHYEYLTRGYEEAKAEGQCYFGELGGSHGLAHLPARVRPGFMIT